MVELAEHMDEGYAEEPAYGVSAPLKGNKKLRIEMDRRKEAENSWRRNQKETKRLAKEALLLAKIGRIISSTLNIEEVYELFAKEAHKLIPFDRIVIALLNSDLGTVTNLYISGIDVEGREKGAVYPLRGTIVEKVIGQGAGIVIQPETVEVIKSKYPSLAFTYQAGLRSMISVPLISRRQAIGALHIRSKKPKAYTEHDLKLVEGIAHQIAGAVANAQLFSKHERAEEARRKSEEEARRLAQENALVAEVGRIIGSTPNIDEVFERFSKAVAKLIAFDRVQINLNNPQKDASLVRYVAGIDVPQRRAGEYVALASTASGECTRSKASLLIQPKDDQEIEKVVGRFPGLLPNFKIGIRSIIMVPLIAEDQTIGVLTFRSIKTKAYTDQTVKLAESIASQIAGAVANAQLYIERTQAEEAARKSEQDARRLAKENEVIAEIGRIISSTLNVEEVYERFTEEAHKLIPIDRTTINIINLDTRTITNVYTWGREIPDRRPGETVPLAGSATEKAQQAKSGLIIKMEDKNEVASWVPGLLPAFRAGTRSAMAIPLISRDQVIGVLHLHSIKPNVYTEKELRIAERVGNQIAGAIANACLYNEHKRAEAALRESEEAEKRLAEENAIVAEIGRIISSTLNIEEVYERFAQEVEKIIPFDRIVINIINSEDDTGTPAYVSGIGLSGRHKGDSFALPGTFTEEIRRTRSSLLLQAEDPKEIREALERYPSLKFNFQNGIRSLISGPLISKDEVIGVLHLRSTKPNAYSEKDLRIVERVGTQIAGAIANAHLYNERLRTEKEMANLQEQFRQSQKMEAVGRLAGGIAHDFNNFLTVMKARSQLALIELKEGDPLKESFEAIDNATTKSANLVRQLLAFSRRQVMEMIVLDLNDLLRDLEKMLYRIIGEDIQLFTFLADDLGTVKADPGQIEQVVLNLVVNARDAMPQGGKLTIETANVELDEAYARSHVGSHPGRYVMLSVSDTGVGMTPEVKEQIFEPFFTTKEKGKGTGLGLATVYGIVKQSGGNIWVYSEPNQGAAFKIYLPWVDQPLAKEKKREAPGLFRGVGVILVVEDEEGVRKVVLEVLKKQGYSVLEADDEDKALLICQQYKDTIHLLLTDVVMPRVSGPELAKHLGAFHPEMKVLYMSGYTDNAIVHHGVLDKGVNYIQKPFTFEGLARKVKEVLDGKTESQLT